MMPKGIPFGLGASISLPEAAAPNSTTSRTMTLAGS